MKKFILVRLDKACDPEVNSLEDVLELVCAPHADDTCECERKSKNKPDESVLSKEALDFVSDIANDLGIDVEQLKKDVIKEKIKVDAKKATEAARAKNEAKAKENEAEIRVRNNIYNRGVEDGYEKCFRDVVSVMKTRLGKFIEDLDDMSKWSFRNGKLKVKDDDDKVNVKK